MNREKQNKEKKRVFVLGCERSGSTWISNVLDSHPGIEYYMEPFAEDLQLYPGFPNRNHYLQVKNNNLKQNLLTNTHQLSSVKYPFLYTRGRKILWKAIDFYSVKLFMLINKLLPFPVPMSLRRYNSLNLNWSKTPFRYQKLKNVNVDVEVIKELRLNFKVALIKSAYPKAKVLIIIRHPGAQIESIIRLMREGHLNELRRSLESFYSYVSSSNRFSKYEKVVSLLDQQDMDRKLILWWLINYEVLISDCKSYCLDYKVVYHEELSGKPISEFRNILSFINATMSPVVEEYIRFSSSQKIVNLNNNSKTVMDTLRDSDSYSKRTISLVKEKSIVLINQMYKEINVIDELQRYSCSNELDDADV